MFDVFKVPSKSVCTIFPAITYFQEPYAGDSSNQTPERGMRFILQAIALPNGRAGNDEGMEADIPKSNNGSFDPVAQFTRLSQRVENKHKL